MSLVCPIDCRCRYALDRRVDDCGGGKCAFKRGEYALVAKENYWYERVTCPSTGYGQSKQYLACGRATYDYSQQDTPKYKLEYETSDVGLTVRTSVLARYRSLYAYLHSTLMQSVTERLVEGGKVRSVIC